ncbi:MAG: transcriptional regulator with XRE-family HTH domain [Litorivivens sp.]|jgi:transcriptional regulator with XRE-family HTH domain
MFQVRLQQILDHLGLSPKDFAEQMGIQRSAISHILNGRNKPSLDFIIKLSKHYPQFNNLWVLHGKDPMITLVTSVTTTPSKIVTSKETPVPIPVLKEEEKATQKVASKVLIFYTDGSFEEFNSNP